MNVKAINSFSNVKFEGRNNNNNKKVQENLPATQPSKGFMSSMKGPVLMAIFLPAMAVGTTSCEKYEVEANANAIVNVGGGCNDCDKEIDFPWELADSLNRYVGDVTDTDIEGNEDGTDGKVLTYIEALRNWEYDRPENLTLNTKLSNKDELRYDHEITDSIKNDVRFTLVQPGDITVITKDGIVTSNVSGLMKNEDGVKTFIHSNGKSGKDGGRIFVYPKETLGPNEGKYVYRGSIESGILYDFENPIVDEESNLLGYDSKKPMSDEYDENILLNGILFPGDKENGIPPTKDSWIKVKGLAVGQDAIKQKIESEK